MAYLKNWIEVAQVLEDSGAKRFNITRTRGESSVNNNAFMYNSEQNFEENKQIAERILQRCAGEILYLTVWRKEDAKTGGCTYTILYESAAPAQPVQPVSQPTSGLYGVGSSVDIDKLTSDIENRLRVQFEKERLEREQEELREARKQFESDKNSAIGLLAQYLAPVAKQVAGHMSHRIGELDADDQVHAPAIVAEKSETQVGAEEQEDVFTDAESDKLYDLMARFKAVEPKYMELIEAVVKMAEAGDGTYTMAKGFLLK